MTPKPQGNRAQREWARTLRNRLRKLGWLDADVVYQSDGRGAGWWDGPGYYRLDNGEVKELLGARWDDSARAVSSIRRGELGPIRVPDGVQEAIASTAAKVVGAFIGGAVRK